MNLMLVDGMNLVRRVHAGVPGDPGEATHAEDVLAACRGSLGRALSQLAPSHGLCVFDAPAPGWRHAISPAYKSSRPPMPSDLATVLPRIKEAFASLGVRSTEVPGQEADDVIASVATRLAARGARVVVLSTDKSLLGLLRPGIRVRNHFEDRDLTEAYVQERFGVQPPQLADYLALVGERSQDIPGVRGIGARGAARLLAEHGDLEAILAAAATMTDRTGTLLRAGADAARLSRRLTGLAEDVSVGLNVKDCRLPTDPRGAAPLQEDEE